MSHAAIGTPQLANSGESYRASPGEPARPVRTRSRHSARSSNVILSDVLNPCVLPPLHCPSLSILPYETSHAIPPKHMREREKMSLQTRVVYTTRAG